MPFIGRDWRAPGDAWVKVSHTGGWEQNKLRPIQLNTINGIIPILANGTGSLHASSKPMDICRENDRGNSLEHNASSASLSSSYNGGESLQENQLDVASGSLGSSERSGESDPSSDDTGAEDDVEENWTPYCKIKGRHSEYIGCTSMSEAFHRLDLARAVVDIRRFNYICKVVQILVNEKLQSISATARKHLFAIIQAIFLHSINKDIHVSTARDLLSQFSSGLDGHVCGSPQLVSRQKGTVSSLLESALALQSTALPDSSEDSVTFLDLPREVLSKILHRLPEHLSMLEAAKAEPTLQALIESEPRQWRTLTQFHFSQAQIDKHRTNSDMTWRHLFFELKKYYGLREVYADLIKLCCGCKTLYWQDHGHPCVSKSGEQQTLEWQKIHSVRITPRNFVDMLQFL